MAGPTFEERAVQVPRDTIDRARRAATALRQKAENEHRRQLARASRVELFASLLEQGYDLEEAERRAFRPRLDQ